MKKYFLILFVLLSFLGCSKKQLPPDVIGEVVFMFEGKVGNDSVLWQAGKNGIYMNTDYFKDSQNLITLYGGLSQKGCTNCDSLLSFELKDIAPSANGLLQADIFALLGSGTLNSYSLDSVVTTTQRERFNFTADNQNLASYVWDFGDGVKDSTGNFATHVYNSKGIKIVKLTTGNPSQPDTISNTFNLDLDSATCRPMFNISFDSNTNSTILSAIPNNWSSIAWNFGNGLTGQGQTDTAVYQNAGVYTITMNANSATCGNLSFKRKLNTNLNNFVNFASYTYTTSIVSILQNLPRINGSAFIITWIKNGKTYKSFKNQVGINQSAIPIFTVKNIAAYNNNEKGDKTIKVEGTLDTYLYNQLNSADSIKIISKKLVIAAAYPL